MLEKFTVFTNRYPRLSNIIRYLTLNFSSCDLCGLQCQTYPLLCEHCYNDLSLFKYADVQGDLLNWPAINRSLPNHTFEQLICLAPYLWPFTLWLTQLKYQGRFEIANLFAQLLNDCWLSLSTRTTAQKSPLILAVPLHVKKWQSRGFNQAHLIADAFSQLAKIPYRPEFIIRTVHTDSQVGQSGGARRKNLRNAFSLQSDNLILPEHVILIDDVVTTGSTANEICRLLKKHGVQRITLLSVCLSLPT